MTFMGPLKEVTAQVGLEKAQGSNPLKSYELLPTGFCPHKDLVAKQLSSSELLPTYSKELESV